MNAIPTTVNGLRFRSRLEATWAAFFDACGWGWEYEPLDLNGYIPDFVLKFYKPLIVEVKPCLTIGELNEHTSKIDDSGWNGEVLILGTHLFDSPFAPVSLGLLRQIEAVEGDLHWCWAQAIFHKCTNCGSFSVYHDEWSYRCRANECYDGNSFHDTDVEAIAKRMWNESKTKSQWNPS